MDLTLIIIILLIVFLVFICFGLAVANFALDKFYDVFKEIDSIYAETDFSPWDYISKLNSEHFNDEIVVKTISNIAEDAYSKKTLYLSGETQASHSLASFAIISHEMGHALQDKKGNELKTLNFLRRFGKILGCFLVPLFIIGIILIVGWQNLFYVGVGLLGACLLILLLALFIKLRMIAIEKQASAYAVDFLTEILNDQQVKLCKKLLDAARLSYWADFFRTLLAWTFMTKKNKLFS